MIDVCAPKVQSIKEIEKFYCTLYNSKDQCKFQEIIFVIEELKARVGKERDKAVDKFELETLS